MRATRLTAVLVGLVAIAMVTTEASAMYHATMGRFLQRDPGAGAGSPARIDSARPAVGGRFMPRDPTGNNQYADGMNLYQYVRSQPTRLVDPLGLAGWGADDFIQHYYTGGGRDVTLNFIGLFFAFQQAPDVRRSVEAFKSQVRAKISGAVGDGLLKCKDGEPASEDYSTWGRDKDVTDVTKQMFSIGQSKFYREYDCTIKINKCDCDKVMDWGYMCRLRLEIRDAFKDPLDIGVEAGGTPYRITGSWTESMSSNYEPEKQDHIRIPLSGLGM